jgi:O-antigen/teichoic acid export membrane protein
MFFKNIVNKGRAILSSDSNQKLFHNSFWIISGNILSKVSLLIATIIMARYLDKNEYGQFGIIKSTILMFAMFAGLELGMTATKYISQYKATNKNLIERIVGLSNFVVILISLLISSLVYIFSEQIAIQIAAPSLFNEIRISSFILFFSSINGLQAGILNGLEKFKQVSINTAIAGVISSIALVFCTFYSSLDAIIVAFGSNFVLLFVFNYFSLKRYFFNEYNVKVFDKGNFKETNVLWKFSLPAILAGLMVGPVIWYCNLLLVNQIGGYEQMAIFDVANQWRNTVLFIPSALSQIALPMLAANLNNRENYRAIFIKNVKLNLYIALIFVTILILVVPIIIWFYGDRYLNATIPMILMFTTTGFVAVNNVIGQAIASQGKMWAGFLANMLWAIILILASWFFIIYFEMGAIGLSIAYLISYIFHTLIQFTFIKKKL